MLSVLRRKWQVSDVTLLQVLHMPACTLAVAKARIDIRCIGMCEIVYSQRVDENPTQCIQVALIFAAAHFMVYALSVKQWMPFIAIILCAVYLISSPAINGIVSCHVSKQQQGQALGALASIKALCAVFGPIMFTQLYGHFKVPPCVDF